MNFKRRHFIVSAGLIAVSTVLPSFASEKTIFLGSKDYHIVSSGCLLKLPEKPKNGHSINLIIPTKSVQVPSRVQSSTAPILGDKEDLILDSFGQIRLTFVSEKVGWQILTS